MSPECNGTPKLSNPHQTYNTQTLNNLFIKHSYEKRSMKFYIKHVRTCNKIITTINSREISHKLFHKLILPALHRTVIPNKQEKK